MKRTKVDKNIKDFDTFEKAKKEAISILDELGFASKYSHSVYMLCNWLLCSVIGLVYHKYINNHIEEVEYMYEDIFYSLEDYISKEPCHKKGSLYQNDLEFDFYLMGGDLFESWGEYKLPNHDYGEQVLACWSTFENAVIKRESSSVYNELLVAISEIIDSVQ